MLFEIRLRSSTNQFCIRPAKEIEGGATENDVEALLDTNDFLHVKNSMIFMQGSLYGRTDNKLHLGCLQKLITEDQVLDERVIQNELNRLIREAPETPSAKPPYMYYQLLFVFEGVKLRRKDGEKYNQFVKPFNDLDKELCNRSTNGDPSFGLTSQARHFVSIDAHESGLQIHIKADFLNISHLNILIGFLREEVINKDDYSMVRDVAKNAVVELDARYLHLCHMNRVKTKADFSSNLRLTLLNEWPSLVNDAMAVKQILIPALSGAGVSFSWVDSNNTDYAKHVTAILADYNANKDFGRTLFGNSEMIQQFAGSQNKSTDERIAILADFLATLIYDTKWNPAVRAENQLPASTSAIVNSNKRKM